MSMLTQMKQSPGWLIVYESELLDPPIGFGGE